jgi:hypothetical protein
LHINMRKIFPAVVAVSLMLFVALSSPTQLTYFTEH